MGMMVVVVVGGKKCCSTKKIMRKSDQAPPRRTPVLLLTERRSVCSRPRPRPSVHRPAASTSTGHHFIKYQLPSADDSGFISRQSRIPCVSQPHQELTTGSVQCSAVSLYFIWNSDLLSALPVTLLTIVSPGPDVYGWCWLGSAPPTVLLCFGA